jgi:hypothetical protein
LRPRRIESIYWWTFLALRGIALYIVFRHKYLPMVDLPGHVAQLEMIRQTLHGAPLPPGFKWNIGTPYLLGYTLAYPWTFLVSTMLSIKILIAVYVIATPLSVRYLLRTLGCETWWSLLFFVFVFSHPFYHGFFSYLVATPFGILTLAISIRTRQEGTMSWRVATVALSLLLFASHLLDFLIVAGMFGAYILGDSTRRRPPWELLLWSPAGVGFALWWISFFDKPVTQGNWDWRWGAARVLEVGAGAIGDARDTQLGWFVFGGLLLLGLVGGIRFRPTRGSLAMFAAIAMVSLTAPAIAAGIAHLSWRLSLWVIVAFFALVAPMGNGLPARLARISTVGLLGLAIGWIGFQVHAFDQEARAFDPVMATMEREKMLHPLIFSYTGEAGPSHRFVFGYLHFGSWYYVEKGGLHAGMFRFAPRHLPIVRERPLFGDRWREDSSFWSEAAFDLEEEGDYDYYLLRENRHDSAADFIRQNEALEVITRSGAWYLLRPKDPTAQGAPPGPGMQNLEGS